MNYIIFFLLLNGFIFSQGKEAVQEQLNKAGLTESQARQIVKDRGLSDEQIKIEAKKRNVDLERISTRAKDQVEAYDNYDDLNYNGYTIEEIVKKDIDEKKIIETNKYEYFGYNIFYEDPSSFQSSNYGAVDPSYNIGPGDQIIVMLWGESQFRQEFSIDREGYVFLPEVGQIFVNGLTLEALEKKFFQIFSKVYSTLLPSSGFPTTFIDVSVGNLRPLRIIVLGEVNQPGAYSVTPSTSLSSSLYYFNGPTNSGSLRDIRLIRDGQLIGSIDFYNFLLSGNIPNDLRLQMDDVIFIPPRGKTVTLTGEVKKEGIYELKETDNIKQLIQMSGDLPISSYMNRAQINRILPLEQRLELGMDRMLIDIDLREALSPNTSIKLYDGDVLEIFPIDDSNNNYVSITGGSVSRPGKYQLTQNMLLSDLINSADGLLNDAYLLNAHLIRTKDDFTKELININIKDALADRSDANIKLKYLDELIVYNKNILKNKFSNISISGLVKKPGSYDFNTKTTLGDLLLRSGGFKPNVNKVKILVSRPVEDSFDPLIFELPSTKNRFISTEDFDNPNSEINSFKLNGNDNVSIFIDPMDKLPDLVHVGGAVHFPGNYAIRNKFERVSDIINRSGGFIGNANPRASKFKRNGKTVEISFEIIVNRPKSPSNMIVMPGDSLFIEKITNTISIIGEVNNPGVFQYFKNYTISDYIKISGGLTPRADKRQIWVNYPDGTSVKKQFLSFSPKIYDSSTIVIGADEDEEPFDLTEFATETTTILANLIQVIVLLNAVK